MYVEICWDEMWLGVICQTNSEIAGSPRNISRYSPRFRCLGVELWLDLGGASCPVHSNYEYQVTMLGVSPIRLSGAVSRETTQTIS